VIKPCRQLFVFRKTRLEKEKTCFFSIFKLLSDSHYLHQGIRLQWPAFLVEQNKSTASVGLAANIAVLHNLPLTLSSQSVSRKPEVAVLHNLPSGTFSFRFRFVG